MSTTERFRYTPLGAIFSLEDSLEKNYMYMYSFCNSVETAEGVIFHFKDENANPKNIKKKIKKSYLNFENLCYFFEYRQFLQFELVEIFKLFHLFKLKKLASN